MSIASLLLLFFSTYFSNFGFSRVQKVPLQRIPNYGFHSTKPESKDLFAVYFPRTGSPFSLSSPHIPLTNLYDSQFFGTIQVGNPPQFFDVIFDTASSGLWLAGAQCKSMACQIRNKYDNSSSTYGKDGTPFSIRYGTSAVQGAIARDTVTIGGIPILEQDFGEAHRIFGHVLNDARFDGVFGLGFENISPAGMIPPTTNLIEDKSLYKPMFSLWLNGSVDSDRSGELILGGVDRSRFEGQVTFAPVVRKGYWEVTIQSYFVGEERFVYRRTAAIASGSTLIIVPLVDSYRLHKQLGLTPSSDGRFLVDCKRIDELSDVSFIIGGRRFNLSPRQYILEWHGECMSAFVGQDLESPTGPLWVLGTVFLKAYYTIFDIERNRVGIAKSK